MLLVFHLLPLLVFLLRPCFLSCNPGGTSWKVSELSLPFCKVHSWDGQREGRTGRQRETERWFRTTSKAVTKGMRAAFVQPVRASIYDLGVFQSSRCRPPFACLMEWLASSWPDEALRGTFADKWMIRLGLSRADNFFLRQQSRWWQHCTNCFGFRVSKTRSEVP